MLKQAFTGFALLAVCSMASAAPLVHTTDFINDGDRSNFSGFENIPNDGTFFTGGSGPYTEDGVSVQQVSGDGGNDIWVTYSGGQHQGNFSWYPNGGDDGYTMITRSGGLDFDSVGIMIGSGFGTSTQVFYNLLNNGASVLSGSFAPSNSNYLGFSGGGYDAVLLSDCSGCDVGTTSVIDNHYQALALDSIELAGAGAVPEPGLLALLAVGLAGLGWQWRTARKA